MHMHLNKDIGRGQCWNTQYITQVETPSPQPPASFYFSCANPTNIASVTCCPNARAGAKNGRKKRTPGAATYC